MENNHLDTLLKKYRENRCTPDEIAELEGWYGQFEKEAERLGQVPREKLDFLYQQIEKNVTVHSRKGIVHSKLRAVIAVAAILSLTIWGGNYFLSQQAGISEESVISPGRYQAELILSDGSCLALDSSTVVTGKNGVLLKEEAQVVLDYSRIKTSKTQEMNTIKVPVGGEYRVILADGTQVWLNSGSSLKFPMTFGGDKREVVLTGEGYFEVTKAAIPFIVKTPQLDVRVLGTSFDVCAYEEDEHLTTTLVTGSIEISGKHIQQSCLLTPGHILTYAKNAGNFFVKECDTELYTSWIKGEFKFRDMRLEEIMIRLNRWYNCSVSYEDPVLKELRFSGAAEKDRPVSYLLKMIETITDVRFRIEDNQIIVMHK